jgi:ATP-binding cassette subfamily C protein CydD
VNRRLLSEARATRRLLGLSIGASLLGGLLLIVQAWLLSAAINRVFLEGDTLDGVSPLLLALVPVIAGRGLLTYAAGVTAGDAAARIKSGLRARLMAHLLALGPTFARGERSGELTNTLTQGVETLDAYFRDYLPQLVISVLVPLAILLAVFPIDLLTGLILLLTAPLIPVFMALIGMAAGALARRQFAALSRLSAHFLDVLQGLPTLKQFNRSRAQIATIGRISEEFRDATMAVLRVAFLSALALEMLATLSVAIVAVEIGVRLIAGNMQFAQALFLLVLAPEFYGPLRTLGAKYHAGTEGKAAAERIFEILDTPLPPTGGRAPVPPRLEITLERVSYTYPRQSRPALADVSLTIASGQRVALVGATGSGKSTLAALLMRFIAPSSGQIHVTGLPLDEIALDAWRSRVAWLPQSPYLFDRSAADNIRLGRPDAPLADVMAAARQAEAHDFIAALPQGYDTPLGERGLRLSGGQAQRIAIARAFLRDPALLVLDEATSALDPETEAAISRALDRLLAGRSALIIAHRLSTVASADQIVVLAQGAVAQQGTHATLLAQPGPYRELVEVGYDVR